MINTVFWQYMGTQTPWGPMDVDASLNFSFDLSDWIAKAGTGLTLASAVFISDSALTVAEPTIDGSLVTTRVAWETASPPQVLNTCYPLTLRFTASDGQHDDRTFYLMYVQR